MMHPVFFIVFLPLIAAIIAGLGGRLIGQTAAKVITTGSLMIGAVLSWPIFLSYVAGSGEPMVVPVLKFIESGAMNVDWALRVDIRHAASDVEGENRPAQRRPDEQRSGRDHFCGGLPNPSPA